MVKTASQSEADAFLAEMLKQLDSAGGGDGMGGEAGMAKLLEGMMEQLMSKDILYEPMKDLQEKVHSLVAYFDCSIHHGWLQIRRNSPRKNTRRTQVSIHSSPRL